MVNLGACIAVSAAQPLLDREYLATRCAVRRTWRKRLLPLLLPAVRSLHSLGLSWPIGMLRTPAALERAAMASAVPCADYAARQHPDKSVVSPHRIRSSFVRSGYSTILRSCAAFCGYLGIILLGCRADRRLAHVVIIGSVAATLAFGSVALLGFRRWADPRCQEEATARSRLAYLCRGDVRHTFHGDCAAAPAFRVGRNLLVAHHGLASVRFWRSC